MAKSPKDKSFNTFVGNAEPKETEAVYDHDPDVTGCVEPEPWRPQSPKPLTPEHLKTLTEWLKNKGRKKRGYTEAIEEAQFRLQENLDEFFDAVAAYDPLQTENDQDAAAQEAEAAEPTDEAPAMLPDEARPVVRKPKMFVMKLPVGFGKTEATISTSLKFMRNRAEEHRYQMKKQGERLPKGYFPLVFSAPTYALLEEIEERYQAAIEEQGLATGLLNIGWYKGKERAGCLKIANEREARGGAQGAVRGVYSCAKPTLGGAITYCEFFGECNYVGQMHALNSSPLGDGVRNFRNMFPEDVEPLITDDLVLAPHIQLIGASQPHVLKHAQGLIVDESLVSLMISAESFDLGLLTNVDELIVEVGEPFPFDCDAKAYGDGDLAFMNRLIGRSLRYGRKPVEEIVHGFLDLHRPVRRAQQAFTDENPYWVLSAFKQLDRAISAFQKKITLQRIIAGNDDAATEAEVKAISLQYDMWKIIREQAFQLRRKYLMAVDRGEIEETRVDNDFFRLPDHDKRISLFTPRNHAGEDIGAEQVRLAWRNKLTIPDCPVLVLDASADRELYRILFGRTHDIKFVEIREEDIGLAQKNVLVTGMQFSKSSLLFQERSEARRDKVLKALKRISDRHDDSLLVVSGKAVAEEIRRSALLRQKPDIMIMTYGALRGIDAARNVDAAVLLSALELPMDALEHKSYALSYDQRPMPIRQAENGNEEQQPRQAQRRGVLKTVTRRLRLRNNDPRRGPTETTIRTYLHQDHYPALLQQQAREQELIQAYGRLRSLRKGDRKYDDWQTAYIMTSACPPNLVIDQIVHINDLSGSNELVLAANEYFQAVSSRSLVALGISTSRAGTPEQDRRAAAKYLRDYGLNENAIRDENARGSREGWAECKVATRGARGKPLSVWVYVKDLDEPEDQMEVIAQRALNHVAALDGADSLEDYVLRGLPVIGYGEADDDQDAENEILDIENDYGDIDNDDYQDDSLIEADGFWNWNPARANREAQLEEFQEQEMHLQP